MVYYLTYMKNLLHRYIVRAQWDAEARVWFATSDDIPGLVSEAESFDALVRNVFDVAPELLALNNTDMSVPLPIHVMADRVEMITKH